MKKGKVFLLIGIVMGVIIFLLIGSGKDATFKDDFYDGVNEAVLLKNPIEEGKYTWSTFTEAQDRVDEEVDQLFQDVLVGKLPMYGILQEKMGIFYDSMLNIEHRNADGLSTLKKYIDDIGKIQDVSSLIRTISLIENELGIDILTQEKVDLDYQNTDQLLVYLYPIPLVFGASVDYFVNEDYMAYKAYVKRAMIQVLEVYGYSKKEAREVVARLISFYEEIGSASKIAEELEAVQNVYHKVSMEELERVYSNFSFRDYLTAKGYGGMEFYNLVDLGQYQKLNEYLTKDYLGLWKEQLLMMVLSTYASYLTEDYEQVVLRLNQGILGSDSLEEDREEREREQVQSLFSEELDWIYASGYQDDPRKAYLEELFEEIRKTYQEMLKDNEWLSSTTKDMALKKLTHLKFYVGLEGEGQLDMKYLENLQVSSWNEGRSFIENLKALIQLRKKQEIEKLNARQWKRLVGESVVNAYYSPIDQAIYVPMAMLQLVDLKQGYAANLGGIGMIIAHEMTHAFDGNGSQYDWKGNFSNWWTDEDLKVYGYLKKQVVDYYSGYRVLGGRFINGEKTVNENIADLGAVRCISKIMMKRKGTDEDFKTMYFHYAKLWAQKSKDEYTKLLLLQDTHAPSKFRVNAVLSSTEEFYQTFHVSFWDNMYISEKNRVQVW